MSEFPHHPKHCFENSCKVLLNKALCKNDINNAKYKHFHYLLISSLFNLYKIHSVYCFFKQVINIQAMELERSLGYKSMRV